MIVLIIAAVSVLANSWHVLSEWIRNNPGEVFTGIAHYYRDYFLYTSFITQGIRGSWVMGQPLFTNELISPTWYYWFYVLLGKLGGLIGLNTFALYNLSLIFLVTLLLGVLYVIAKRLFPSAFLYTLCFVFLATASNFSNSDGTLIGMSWFSPTPALNRLGGVPHQTLQTILLLAVMLLWERPKWLVLTLVISVVAATTNPIQMLLLAAAISAVSLYRRKNVAASGMIIIATSIGGLASNYEVSRQQLFAIARDWEESQRVSASLWDWVVSLGPIAFLIPLGIVPYFRKRDPLRLVTLLYGMFSFIAFFSPIPSFLNVAAIRWLHPAPYILWPILATEGVQTLLQQSKKIRSLVVVTLLTIYILFTVPAIVSQVRSRLEPLTGDATVRTLNHIPKATQDALVALGSGDTTGVILTNPSLPYDVIIPSLTGRKSFTGHPIHTLYPKIKEELRRKYFESKMTEEEKQKFLKDHNITVIFP